MSRVLVASIIASSALLSQLANAEEDYRFEISAAVAEGSLADSDTEATQVNASFYFDTVSGDDLFPIAESAYVAKVNSLTVGMKTSETSDETSSEETTAIDLEYRLVTEEDKIWRISFHKSEVDVKDSKFDPDFAETAEFMGAGIAFGAYISESSSFEISYQKNIYDGDNSNIEDTQNFGISFRSVKELEESGYFAFDLSFNSEKQNILNPDGRKSLTNTTALFKPEYYLNRNLSFYASLSSIRNREQSTTTLGAGVNWFVLSGLKLSLAYEDLAPKQTGEKADNGDQFVIGLSARI